MRKTKATGNGLVLLRPAFWLECRVGRRQRTTPGSNPAAVRKTWRIKPKLWSVTQHDQTIYITYAASKMESKAILLGFFMFVESRDLPNSTWVVHVERVRKERGGSVTRADCSERADAAVIVRRDGEGEDNRTGDWSGSPFSDIEIGFAVMSENGEICSRRSGTVPS